MVLFQIQGGYRQLAVPENFDEDITNWDTSNVLSMEEVLQVGLILIKTSAIGILVK